MKLRLLRPDWFKSAPVTVSDPWLEEMRFNNQLGLNNLVIISGQTGSSKSEIAHVVAETLDPQFLNSYVNGAPHLSTDPVPIFQLMKARLAYPGIWWILDEPKGQANTKWADKVGQALREYTEQGFRYQVVNVIMCTVMFQKLNNNLRGYSHYWVETWGRLHPGIATVKRLELRTKIVTGVGPVQTPTPKFIERINWFGHRPSPEILYGNEPGSPQYDPDRPAYHGYLWHKNNNFQFTQDYWINYFESPEGREALEKGGYRVPAPVRQGAA